MEIKARPRPKISSDLTCPHCGEPVSAKAKTCAHCNGPLFHGGTTIETPVCPRCRAELKKVKTEGEDELETCPNCGGYWLDYQNFARATNPQRLSKEYADSKNHWHKPEQGPIQYVSCPRCGRYMNRENFSRISGIVIDRCGDHGVWLDEGELDRIRLFIVNGGLERLQDKRLENLNIEMQELAGRVRGEEFMTGCLIFGTRSGFSLKAGFNPPAVFL